MMLGLPLLTWTVRSEDDRKAARTLGRPDDFRGISAVNSARRTGTRRHIVVVCRFTGAARLKSQVNSDEFRGKVGQKNLPQMTDVEVRIRIAQSLAEVPAAAWNACAAQSDQSVNLNQNMKLN